MRHTVVQHALRTRWPIYVQAASGAYYWHIKLIIQPSPWTGPRPICMVCVLLVGLLLQVGATHFMDCSSDTIQAAAYIYYILHNFI